jgi:hypothetical protein
MFEVGKKRYGLERFTKALRHSSLNLRSWRIRISTHHLVRKNTVEAIVVEGDQPIKTLELVRAHQSMND